MSGLVRLGYDLMAVLSPTTGTRATGSVLVQPTGKDEVAILRNQTMFPSVNGVFREDLPFKTAEGPDDGGGWTIAPSGTEVDIVSVVGGKRHNLDVGTKMRFAPQLTDIQAECTVRAAITDGADPTHVGGALGVVQFEQLNIGSFDLDTFRSQVSELPAVIVVWDGSEPADGTTQSSLARGATRVGVRRQLFKERFNLFVLSRRMESHHVRRSEAAILLEDITDWLTDRQEVDGRVFSSPTGVQIRGRSRIIGKAAAFQQVYVYVLQLSVTATLVQTDTRTWSPWLRTHNEFLTYLKDGSDNRLTIVNQDIDMNP